jgi:F-type H+-transporting ATPase subunit delta
MKRHTAKQYAHALYEATRDLSGKSLDFAVRAFGDILLRDRAIHMTDAIIAEYDAHAKKQAGEIELKVTTATEITDSHKKVLKNVFDSTHIVETIDPDVVGGIKVRVGDTIYDATIKTQLIKLKESLLA